MKRRLLKWVYLAGVCLMAGGCNSPQKSEDSIRIVNNNGAFELYVDGVRTYIKGIGGTNRVDMAHENGANAFRTWGGSIESIQKDVELARANDMLILQGIGMTKDSASYFNEEYKNKVREDVRSLAEAFKDEPQILGWGLGNEIELANANMSEAWIFVEELAQLIKSIDKRHLVSTVISHNAKALDFIATHCPSIDFVGINSYGSIVELEEMVNNSLYKGSFMVTEWGPSGFWELPFTSWGAPLEQTSEEKRIVYEERYNKYILANKRCLGSFVFLWGQKEERTPTWFSMFVEQDVEGLPLQGEMTPMVEAMQRVWTQQELTKTAPVVTLITLNGTKAIDNATVKAGTNFTGEVTAYDKEGDKLTYIWEILEEATVLGFGGSYEPRPDRVGEVVTTDVPTYTSSLKQPGNYRLYVYVSDNTGYVGTTNIPFQVVR